MGHILDVSGWQKSKSIDWATFSKYVDLLIARVQHGSSRPDTEYKNHVANAKQFGLPFLSYAFPAFISVDDARVEARDAHTRQDPESKSMVIDIEEEQDINGNPLGITKLSPSVRLDGIRAFVDELRKQGEKNVGAYIASNVYDAWGIHAIVDIFDWVWIPHYGANDGQPNSKPAYPCDMWQFTSVGQVPGYNGPLDLSVLCGNKTLDWFTGKAPVPAPEPTPPHASTNPVAPYIPENHGVVGRVKVIADKLNIRQAPNVNAAINRVALKGEEFDVYANVNDWHNVGGANWVFGNKGQYLSLIPNTPPPTIQYYTVVPGDALSKIASKFSTTLGQLEAWNHIADPNKIWVGQKLRVK